MKRQAWLVTLSAGLIASLVPACTHSNGNAIKPAAAQQPAAPTLAQGPRWPVDPAQGEVVQNATPDTFPRPTERSPYGSDSLLTGSPERVRKNQSPQPAESLLGSDPPVLLNPGQPPQAVPGSGPPATVPAQPDARKAPPPDEPIVLALRSLLNDHPQEALELLKCYDACNQEALICLTATVARLTKKKLDQLSPAEVATLQDQLQKSLLGALRPRSQLLIDKMCFCEWIKGYRVYKPVAEDYEFQPRVGDRPGDMVQLYVELRNMTSEPRNGAYVTGLHSTMRIFDAAAKEVFFRDIPDGEGPFRTWSPLPDYYKSYRFYAPPLPPGRYQLRLEVRDVTRPEAVRVASKSLEFRVAEVFTK